jgi:hypothetical protein
MKQQLSFQNRAQRKNSGGKAVRPTQRIGEEIGLIPNASEGSKIASKPSLKRPNSTIRSCLPHGRPGQFRDSSCKLDASWAGTDDCQERRLQLRIGFPLCALEGRQETAPDRCGILASSGRARMVPIHYGQNRHAGPQWQELECRRVRHRRHQVERDAHSYPRRPG